jgi:hypothetical protein
MWRFVVIGLVTLLFLSPSAKAQTAAPPPPSDQNDVTGMAFTAAVVGVFVFAIYEATKKKKKPVSP